MMVARRSFPFQKAKLWGFVCIYNQCPPTQHPYNWRATIKIVPHDHLPENMMNWTGWTLRNHAKSTVNIMTSSWCYKCFNKNLETRNQDLFGILEVGKKNLSCWMGSGFGGLMVESMVGTTHLDHFQCWISLVPRSKSSMKSRTQAKFCVRSMTEIHTKWGFHMAKLKGRHLDF